MMEKMIHKLDHTLKDIIDHSVNSRTEIKREQVNIQEIIDHTLITYLSGRCLTI
jgi:hypothetical protein